MTDSSESDNEDLTSKAKKKPAVIEDDDDDDHEGMIFQVFLLKLVSYYYTHWSYYTRKFPLFFKYTYQTIAKYIFGKR